MHSEITSSLPLHPVFNLCGFWSLGLHNKYFTDWSSPPSPIPAPSCFWELLKPILQWQPLEIHLAEGRLYCSSLPGLSAPTRITTLPHDPHTAIISSSTHCSLKPHDGSHKLEEDLLTQTLRLRGSLAPSQIPGSLGLWHAVCLGVREASQDLA